MTVLKDWWIWIALAAVLIVLVVVRFVVASSYIEDWEESTGRVVQLQDELETTARKPEALPTQGDIELAQQAQSRVEAETEKVIAMWEEASRAFDQMHDKTPEAEFVVYLHRQCQQMFDDLAREVARIRGTYEEGSPLPQISNPQNNQLADLTRDYDTVRETILPWRHYLISKRLHEAAGRTRVGLANSFALADNDRDDEEFVRRQEVRTVERLNRIIFGEVKESTVYGPDLEEEGSAMPGAGDAGMGEFGGMGGPDRGGMPPGMGDPMMDPGMGEFGMGEFGMEPGMGGDIELPLQELPVDPKKTYADAYPVDVEVYGHVSVIQEYVRQVLATPDMVFFLRGIQIESLSSEAGRESGGGREMAGAARRDAGSIGFLTTQAPEGGAPGTGREMRGGEMPGRRGEADETDAEALLAPVSRQVSYTHEPAVRAILTFDALHFHGFRKEREEAEAQNQADSAGLPAGEGIPTGAGMGM
jgi:hypothetical protein